MKARLQDAGWLLKLLLNGAIIHQMCAEKTGKGVLQPVYGLSILE
jgi:hypothetical protein